MNAVGPELARHRLRYAALGRLGGGTGRLGTLIANAVLDKSDVQLRLLGGALESLCRGASTVISAVQGGPDVLIEGQRNLYGRRGTSERDVSFRVGLLARSILR